MNSVYLLHRQRTSNLEVRGSRLEVAAGRKSVSVGHDINKGIENETALWKEIRNKQFGGVRENRKKVVADEKIQEHIRESQTT